MNKDITKAFLALNIPERKRVTNLLIDVGLCIEFKTDFRALITQHKAQAKGKALKVYTLISNMTKVELDSAAGSLVRLYA